MLKFFLFILGLLAVSGCGGHPEHSDLNYQVLDSTFLSKATLSDVRNDWIRICIKGQKTNEDLVRAKDWTQKAMLVWLRTYAAIDTQVSSNIHFTCEQMDLDITIRYGVGTGVAKAGWTQIWSHRPFATWTHEFGHALAGLGDTYQSGRPGQCERRQPRSRMCWGGSGPRGDMNDYSTLFPDDIAGAQAAYRRVFSDLKAPSWGPSMDLEGPVDFQNPWPGASNQIRDELIFSEDGVR